MAPVTLSANFSFERSPSACVASVWQGSGRAGDGAAGCGAGTGTLLWMALTTGCRDNGKVQHMNIQREDMCHC